MEIKRFFDADVFVIEIKITHLSNGGGDGRSMMVTTTLRCKKSYKVGKRNKNYGVSSSMITILIIFDNTYARAVVIKREIYYCTISRSRRGVFFFFFWRQTRGRRSWRWSACALCVVFTRDILPRQTASAAPDGGGQLLPVDQLIRIVNKACARARHRKGGHTRPAFHGPSTAALPSGNRFRLAVSRGSAHRDHCLLADPTLRQSLVNREPCWYLASTTNTTTDDDDDRDPQLPLRPTFSSWTTTNPGTRGSVYARVP